MVKREIFKVLDGFKYCQKCHKVKPENEFSAANTKSGVRSKCKQCNSDESKVRYKKDRSSGKTSNALRMKARMDLKRELVAEGGGRCVRCGYSKSLYALDFHHVGNDKEHGLADLLTLAISHGDEYLEKTKAEAAKCVILCANCHREIHAEGGGILEENKKNDTPTRKSMIGGTGKTYEFWSKDGQRKIAVGWFDNDADAVSWFKLNYPSVFAFGAEMKVFE